MIPVTWLEKREKKVSEYRLDPEAKYARSHEWVRIEEGVAVVGISDAAQNMMSDIVFVDLPDLGADVSVGEPVAVVESVKAAEDVLAPVSGTIVAVNGELIDTPGLVNDTPYSAWLFKIQPGDELDVELDALLSPEAYGQFVGEEGR